MTAATHHDTGWSSTDTVSMIALLAVATSARLSRMTTSLWQDEGYTLSAIHHLNGFDAQRPVYFVFMRAWVSLGQSEIWLRLPSFVCGIACVASIYAIARKLGSRRQAVLAAGFMALSTPFAFHSQEARMYSLAPLLVLFAAYAWLRWREQGARSWLVTHAVVATVAVLTFPLAGFGLAGLWGLEVWQHRRAWRRALPIVFAAFAVVVVWLPFAVKGVSNRWGIAWIPKPAPLALFEIQAWAFASRNPFQLELGPAWGPGLVAVVLALAVVGATQPRHAGLATIFFGCTSALFAISLVKPIWVPRYLTPLLPGLFLLTAAGLERVFARSRGLGVALGAAVFASQVACLAHAARNPTIEDWRSVGADVARRAEPADQVIVSQLPLEANGVGVWSHYYSGAAPLTYFTAATSAAWMERVQATRALAREGSHTWLVLADTSLDEAERLALASALGRTFQVEGMAAPGIHYLRIRD